MSLSTRVPISEIGQEYSSGNWRAEQRALRDQNHKPLGDADTLFRTQVDNTVTTPILRQAFPCFKDQDAFNKAPDAGDLVFFFNRPTYKGEASQWDDRIHGQKAYLLTFQQLQYLLRIEWQDCVRGYLYELVKNGKIRSVSNGAATPEVVLTELLESDEIFKIFKYPDYNSEAFTGLNLHKIDPMLFLDMQTICDSIKFWGTCFQTLYKTTSDENDSVTCTLRGDCQIRNIWPQYDKVGSEIAVYLVQKSRLEPPELFILPTGVEHAKAASELRKRGGYEKAEIKKMSTIGRVNIEADYHKLSFRHRDKNFIDQLQNRVAVNTTPGEIYTGKEVLNQDTVSNYKSDQKLSRITMYLRPF